MVKRVQTRMVSPESLMLKDALWFRRYISKTARKRRQEVHISRPRSQRRVIDTVGKAGTTTPDGKSCFPTRPQRAGPFYAFARATAKALS